MTISTGTRSLASHYPDGTSVRTGNYDGGLFDPPPDFAKLAETANGYGESVSEPQEVGPALRRGLEQVRKGVPAVIAAPRPTLSELLHPEFKGKAAIVDVPSIGRIPCYYTPLQEGYRAWGVGLGLMAHLSGLKLDAAYEYLNWYQSGWQGGFIAKQGYYSSVPETVKPFLTPAEWDYWYEGKPAKSEITDPYGHHIEDAGHVRDGGSLWERTGKVACWNTVMDESRYMVRKWNEFIAA